MNVICLGIIQLVKSCFKLKEILKIISHVLYKLVNTDTVIQVIFKPNKKPVYLILACLLKPTILLYIFFLNYVINCYLKCVIAD